MCSNLNNVKAFYDERALKNGNSIESVGWSSVKSQHMRFEVLIRDIDINNKNILDVGCGFGDLAFFLRKRGYSFNYVGIDISSEIIKIAREKWAGESNIRFYESEFLLFDSSSFLTNIAVASGVLTYKIENNWEYTKLVLAKMFSLAEHAVSVNFMSSYVDYVNEKNFHYAPEEMFSFCKTLTRRVNLLHDYPLYEFTVQLFK